MKRLLTGLAVMGLLAGCAADTGKDSAPAVVAAAAYQAPGPRTLTVFTMVNNRTGKGGHSSLLINASQQVLFDPAGSFRDSRLAERGDVLYGVTPEWVNAYKSAHARSTYHVVTQQIEVTEAQAERALQLAIANGPVPGAYCTQANTGILSQIPGFGGITRTFYPVDLMNQIARMPGVRTDRYYEDDSGDVVDAVRAAQLAQ